MMPLSLWDFCLGIMIGIPNNQSKLDIVALLLFNNMKEYAVQGAALPSGRK